MSIRQWKCSCCGASHERDVNTAINLANYAVSYTVPACGGGRLWLDAQATSETSPCEAGI